MAKQSKSTDLERKTSIMEATLYCFLHYGYSKTSMDDVAKKAGLSRTLIYLNFKNKEDLLVGLFDDIMGKKIAEASEVLELKLSKHDKLTKIFTILFLEPWERISGYPKSEEFFATCDLIDPKTCEKSDKQKIKICTAILGDKLAAEVLINALEGQMYDLPSTAILKKRIEILIDKFSN